MTMGWMDWPPVDLRTPLERMGATYALPLAVRMQPVTWPLVDSKRHPHKAERRDGPRSDSYFARLAKT